MATMLVVRDTSDGAYRYSVTIYNLVGFARRIKELGTRLAAQSVADGYILCLPTTS